MVDNVKLYINDQLVDLSTNQSILWTYQVTDMSNPTAVKNSFTKTITLDGTPQNNDIFDHYWNVERFLLNDGAYFNSSKKAPFQLFLGSTLYEDGYAKLDSIEKTGSKVLYKVTLYGGLGDFFQCLSTTDDGNEKKLSDLTYINGNDEFDFVANIDTVKGAWDALKNGTSGKWQYINFMPAYNGLPEDFDANKVVMNLSGTTIRTSVKDENSGNWYGARLGWTVGTLPEDMTEWEIRDLRSYLQRPCIRMKEIINACCDPQNNGGYTVNLDSDFFADSNSYWDQTWMSLPMIQNLENHNEQQILTGATLEKGTVTGDTTGLMYQDLHFDIGEIAANVSSIDIDATIALHSIYSKSSFVWFWNSNGDSYHSGWWCLGSLFCQLIALNGDVVVGASDVYNLTTPVRHNGKLWYGHNGHYPDSSGIDTSTGRQKIGNGSKYIPYMDKPIYNVLGDLDYYGFKREGESSAATFNFHIDNIGSTVTGLKMVYYWGATANKMRHFNQSYVFDETTHSSWAGSGHRAESTLPNDITLTVLNHNINAVLGESLGRTGTKVTKQLLLNTESTPCDYLLSYAKMFGLHFVKRPGEKVIDVMTRKTFYQRDNVVDLNDYIDHGKDMTTIPLMFSSKWYEFLQEKDESELQSRYLTAKGVEYGEKVINTGYDFDLEKKNLLEDNCIKSGIECVEKSKWYTAYNNDSSLRPWMLNGFKYTLWYGDNSVEADASSYIGSGSVLPLNEGEGLKYYDLFPKLQFHGSDNSPVDGNNCLVFFSGFKSLTSGRSNPLTYTLSDDSSWQTQLNEGTPCWLFSNVEVVNNKRICYHLTELPVFERYLTGNGSGTVMKSLDFGSAQELYIPNYNLTDDTNIYHDYWRTYMTDLFDVNTRQMNCHMRVLGQPNQDWFRRFYWFDNAIWTLNKLTDWNPASIDTCKAEFIKVQDIDDYSSRSQVRTGTISLSADVYSVHYTGGTVTVTVTTDPGVSWRITLAGGSIVTLSSSAGTGTQNITATFGANTEEYVNSAYFTATRNDNAYSTEMCITQGYEGEQNMVARPRDLIFPYSGGTQTVNFTWYNQGDSYVDYIDWNEGEDYLDFAVDLATGRYENYALVSVDTENTGDTVLHNYCSFRSYTYDGSSAIGIDQLPEGFDFDFSGGTVTLPFPYADEVTFLDLPYWITAINNLDGTYDIVAAANPLSDPRSGSVTVSVGESSAPFNVRQGYDEEVFKVTRTDGSGNIIATGQTAELHIDSSTGWTVTTDAAFVTLSKSGGTTTEDMTVDFTLNPGETRQATLVFTDENGTVINYVLTQSGDDSNENLGLFQVERVNGSGNIPASGGTAVIEITSVHKAWSAETDNAFINLSITGASTTARMTVTFSANTGDARYCVIDFTDALGQYVSWSQTQDGHAESELGVQPDLLVFDATGGTKTVNVNIGTNWDVVTYPGWVTCSPESGNTSATVSVTAIPYSGAEQRTGTVVFMDNTTDTPYVVTCVQKSGDGEILAVSPSSLLYQSGGGTKQLIIISNTDWTIG